VNAHKQLWAASGLMMALVLGATLTDKARAEEYATFHVVGHLKLPATKVPNDFHHMHLSESNTAWHGGQRFISVSDSDNVMTIIDVTDSSSPTLARRVRLPAVVAHGDPVMLIGGVALVAEGTNKPETPAPRTISIVNINRQAESKVTGRFENVSELEVDATHTHIYLISGDELWILGGKD